MFLGEYRHVLDSKHRVSIPLRLREIGNDPNRLWNTFILTRGADNCIFGYTPDDWDQLIRGIIRGGVLPGDQLRRFSRTFGSAAVKCTCDRQGRVVIDAKLRRHGGLSRDVVWAGALDHIELWDARRWDTYDDESMAKFAETFETMVQQTRGIVLPGDDTPKGNPGGDTQPGGGF